MNSNTLKNIKGFEKYLRMLKLSSRILNFCHVIDTKTISSSINNINMGDLLEILIAYSRVTERDTASPWHKTMRIQNLLPVFTLILASVQADPAAQPRTLQGWVDMDKSGATYLRREWPHFIRRRLWLCLDLIKMYLSAMNTNDLIQWYRWASVILNHWTCFSPAGADRPGRHLRLLR